MRGVIAAKAQFIEPVLYAIRKKGVLFQEEFYLVSLHLPLQNGYTIFNAWSRFVCIFNFLADTRSWYGRLRFHCQAVDQDPMMVVSLCIVWIARMLASSRLPALGYRSREVSDLKYVVIFEIQGRFFTEENFQKQSAM